MPTPVPYSGTMDVTPQDRPLSPVHVDTPIAAFGGAVAGAVTHMGEVAEGAGKELFARAYAMQQLNQQDVANKAISDYQNDLTQSYVDYTKNQGQDAIDKYPDFQKSTEDLRQQYADKMPSPEAVQLFNQESRNSRFRTVFGAGNYAREEAKRFGNQSAALRVDSAGDNLAATAPGDPAAMPPVLDRIRQVAGQNAEENGFHPGTPEYSQRVAMGVSSAVAKSARELLKSQPLKGQQFIQDQLKSGNLTETDAANLAPIAERAVVNQGARSTGNDILTGKAGDWGAKSVDTGRALDVLSKSSGTGGYQLIGKESPDGNGHPIGKYGVPSTELQSWLKDSGMPAMTEEQFLSDPKSQDALAQSKFGALQKQYGSFDEAMKVWSSGIDPDNRLQSAHKALVDSASHAELSSTAASVATKLQPNNPMFTEATSDHVMTERSKTDAFLAKDKFDNGNTVYDAVTGINSPSGKVPTSIEELLADPKTRDAYDKLDAKGQHAVQQGIIKNIREGGFAPSVAGEKMYEKLYGIGVSPDATPEQRQQLIDADPSNLPMPLAQRQTIQKLRAKVFDQAVANPDLSHAMQVLAPVLNSYNITKASDPDRYMSFQGALHDALQGYGEGQSKAVRSDDDIKKIGTQLLQVSKGQGYSFWKTLGLGGSGSMEFEQPGTEVSRALAKRAFQGAYGRDPTDAELGTVLLRAQFQQSGKSSGTKSINRVPQQ